MTETAIVTEGPEPIECPFCDSLRVAVPGTEANPDQPEQIMFCVFCLQCGAEGPMGDTYAEAVKLWNKRPVK